MTAIRNGLDEPPRPRIRLVKTSTVFGRMPVGHIFEIVGKHDDEDRELRHRAYALLKRAMPDENPMEWEVDGQDGDT
jgi:hypothetical protein